MKRTLSALPLLGTLALALPACEGGDPQTPSENAASTTSSQAQEETGSVPEQDLDGTDTQEASTMQDSTTEEGTGETTPDEGQSSSESKTNTSELNSSGTPSDEETSSEDTGPVEVPAPYAGQTNPLDAKETGVIFAGGLRYKKNCGCHLPESQKHDPDAPDLGHPDTLDIADDWLLWRISEGVAPKMGPFKDTFDETERWQIISYLRALASRNKAKGGG